MVAVGLAATVLAATLGLNAWVEATARRHIIDIGQAAQGGYDCIAVLGAGLAPDGTPSPILAARLDTAAELYRAGASDVVLVTGDNSRLDYDEVGAMERYAIAKGVPPGAIIRDHAGFSTYESMYRLRDVFGADRVLVVTQRYHLYRALFDARKLGLAADGVPAALPSRSGQRSRDAREVLASVKDVFYVLFDKKPTFLGDPIQLVPAPE
ncbi:MAG: YdcF family protein [Bifidobacteriaceae bacterium]|jgi:vancomycin permeability regulator SanA|nr:YdcF family protein [Bifidobacteriaceae bacterium]